MRLLRVALVALLPLAGTPLPAASQVLRGGRAVPALPAVRSPVATLSPVALQPSLLPLAGLSPLGLAPLSATGLSAPLRSLPAASLPVPSDAPAPAGRPAPGRLPVAPEAQGRVPERSAFSQVEGLVPFAGEEGDSRRDEGSSESAAGSLGASFDGVRTQGRGGQIADSVTRWTVGAAWSAYRRRVKLSRYRAALTDESLPPGRRAAAARLLGKIRSVGSLPALEKASRAPAPGRVQAVAAAARERHIVAEAPALIRELKFMPFTSRRMTAARSLSWLTSERMADASVDALSHAAVHDFSTAVRLAALEGLAAARSPGALVALHWMDVHERAPQMRAAVEKALAEHLGRTRLPGQPGHVEPLAQVPPRFGTGAIKAAIVYGYIAAVAELAGGIATGTLSLKADSINLFGNRTMDSIALFSLWLARRTPTAKWTYGWLKSEALLALAASLGIGAIAVSMIPGAWHLLLHPEPAHGWIVAGFAALSVSSNLLSAAVLRRHKDVNSALSGAYHTARADALGTSGLIVATLASLLLGIHVLMPIATFVLIAMILHVAWNIFWPAVRTLLDSAPAWLDSEELRADLLAVPGVKAVFHMHLRALNSVAAELSVKLYVEPGADAAAVLRAAKSLLAEKQARYKIVQATIQIEPLPVEAPAASGS